MKHDHLHKEIIEIGTLCHANEKNLEKSTQLLNL